jgi:hypothetical protein
MKRICLAGLVQKLNTRVGFLNTIVRQTFKFSSTEKCDVMLLIVREQLTFFVFLEPGILLGTLCCLTGCC